MDSIWATRRRVIHRMLANIYGANFFDFYSAIVLCNELMRGCDFDQDEG